MGGDAVQPGTEPALFLIESGQGTERGDEDLLRQIHGKLAAYGLAVEKGVDLPVIEADQLVRGAPVPFFHDPPDQLPLLWQGQVLISSLAYIFENGLKKVAWWNKFIIAKFERHGRRFKQKNGMRRRWQHTAF